MNKRQKRCLFIVSWVVLVASIVAFCDIKNKNAYAANTTTEIINGQSYILNADSDISRVNYSGAAIGDNRPEAPVYLEFCVPSDKLSLDVWDPVNESYIPAHTGEDVELLSLIPSAGAGEIVDNDYEKITIIEEESESEEETGLLMAASSGDTEDISSEQEDETSAATDNTDNDTDNDSESSVSNTSDTTEEERETASAGDDDVEETSSADSQQSEEADSSEDTTEAQPEPVEEEVTAQEEELPVMPALSRDELIPKLITAVAGGNTGYSIEDLFCMMENINYNEGQAWREINDLWNTEARGGYVNVYNTSSGIPPLPVNLPYDNSLCIVVLGYQLTSGGGITGELTRRLEAAYQCAVQYPNAYILTTGGATASGNRNVTEAGVMADWLVEHGIDRSRIIVESRAMSTLQNAIKSCDLLASQYPQVTSMVIVSSEYHIPLGSMLFETQGLMMTCNRGSAPLRVVGNVGASTGRGYSFSGSSISSQMRSLRY